MSATSQIPDWAYQQLTSDDDFNLAGAIEQSCTSCDVLLFSY